MRLTHGGVGSYIHNVLDATLLFRAIISRHLDFFYVIPPVRNSAIWMGKSFSRILLGSGVCINS